jgi:hypothetical protein
MCHVTTKKEKKNVIPLGEEEHFYYVRSLFIGKEHDGISHSALEFRMEYLVCCSLS